MIPGISNEYILRTARKPVGLLSFFLTLALTLPAIMQSFHTTNAAPVQSAARDKWKMNEDNIISFDSFANAGDRFPPEAQADFAAAVAEGKSQAAAGRYARAQQGSASYLALSIEFDSARSCNNFRVRGAAVFTRFDRFADVFIPADKSVYDAVSKASGVLWVEIARTHIVPPVPVGRSAPPTKQPPEQIVRGGHAGLTGKGVTIAIIDTGVDFRNPDFITYDSAGRPTSRLLYLWDTLSDAFSSRRFGMRPPISYPNGAPIGTVYTREQLTAELRAAKPQIPATDLDGHGTACAGIAAGNGNNAPDKGHIKGVAPEADIIAVRIGTGPHLENTYLLNAICGWLDSVVGPKPLVVSCSFGQHDGGHDGQSINERQLNARFSTVRRGRALVVSAGNEARAPFHSELGFKDKANAGLLAFTADSDVMVKLYFDSGDIKDIRVAGAGKTRIAQDGLSIGINPFTKQVVATVRMPAGDGAFYVYNNSGTPMRADAYILGGEFDPASANSSKTVAAPGTAENAITVGSYDWNDEFDVRGNKVSLMESCERKNSLVIGGLSCYSSIGYSRNGTVKPDVVAPGQYYYASYARKLDGGGVGGKIVDTSGRYCLFNGTSAAAPYVAGVVALIMQKRPTITLGEVKRLLQRHAGQDDKTGKVPNMKWGYGKLNMAAINNILKALG